MNAVLLHKIQGASPDSLKEIKAAFEASPVMQRFITFLKQCKSDKFRTSDAVVAVYAIKKNNADYAQYENRFYKLRKKLSDHLANDAYNRPARYPEEQQWLTDAQALLSSGKFREAQTLLIKTEKQCWRNNIFEILPDVIDTLIQANQAMNAIEQNEPLHKKFPQALQLHTDLLEAVNLCRRIYEVNMMKGIKATEPFYARLAKLIVKHRSYPRFKLLYNFVSAYYKAGTASPDYINRTHIITRHIAVCKKILQQHPDLPGLLYQPGYTAFLNYRLREIHTICYFNALRFKEAAAETMQLFELVMSDNSSLKRMRNEVLYTNTIHVLVAAEDFEGAQRVLDLFHQFLQENKNYERLLLVYYEMTNVHTAMYPQVSKYDPKLLLTKMDAYLASDITIGDSHLINSGLMLKLKLLAVEHQYDEALAITNVPGIDRFFDEAVCMSMTRRVLKALSQPTAAAVMQKLRRELRQSRLSLRLNSPGDYNWLLFLEKLLRGE
jgi:tetratricopeptide (TPR) repeat protein